MEYLTFSAPGRVELGGNHTDHQHGCVLAAAIDRTARARVRPTGEGVVRVFSRGYAPVELAPDDLPPRQEERNTTAALVRGMAAAFRRRGLPWRGFDAWVESDVLPGSGLSSSAAFEVLLGRIGNALFAGNSLTAADIARMGQWAENVYFGKPCGLMDQLASSTGGLVFMDFRDPAAPLVRRLMPKISHVAAAQMQTTCAFTMAQGAAAANVLPVEASVTANLRLIHHQPNEESFAVLDAIAQKYDLKREILYQDPPRKPVDFRSWQFRFLESVAADIYPGYDVVPYIMTGGTDAKFFDEISDCSLRFAPIEIDAAQYESIHSRDENLYARALVPAVDFYKEILKGYPAQSRTAR